MVDRFFPLPVSLSIPGALARLGEPGSISIERFDDRSTGGDVSAPAEAEPGTRPMRDA